jgi:hypothetical protein
MTDAPALVDTNVFVDAVDADAPEQRKMSRDHLARCFRSETKYAVSVRNLAEFSVVVTETMPNPLTADIAAFTGGRRSPPPDLPSPRRSGSLRRIGSTSGTRSSQPRCSSRASGGS